MQRNPKHRGLTYVLLLLALTVILIGGLGGSPRIGADAGFGDYNDYDSYDYGSYNDYDYGGYDTYDYGSDDYGSGHYYFGGSYDSGSSGGTDSESDGNVLISLLFLLFMIFLVVYVISRYKKDFSSGRGTAAGGAGGLRVQHDPAFDARTFPNRNEEIAELVQKTDPDFSAEDFIAFVKNVYMDIQDAWCRRDLTPVRAILHENLYAQTEKQIIKKKNEGLINALESIAIGTAYLTSAKRDDEFEYLTVYLVAKMIDYQYKEDTKEVVRGNKTTRWELAYRMRFQRARGSTSGTDGDAQAHLCPNCGAPLPPGASVVCSYCGSSVNTTKSDWVLSEFQTVRRDMTDEGIQWQSAQDKARAEAIRAAEEAAKRNSSV
ncbi:MAG: TIM44-like domain-containing protein [Eubacteriales bacterium]|nr:TIM44-like domain-containing protein [Eubacteriales bacterium]